MQAEDGVKFRAVIGSMLRIYGQVSDQVVMDGYWLALSDWPLEEFEQAAEHLMGISEFMPRPAAFNALRKVGRLTPGEAFEKARQIVRRLNWREMNSYQSGDPRLDAAMRACGGYEALGMCTSENIGFFERRFAEHYESIGDADETRTALPGITFERADGPRKLGSMNIIEKWDRPA